MASYRIAVCEDDPVIQEQIAETCRTILGTWGAEAEIDLFPSADRLRAEAETDAVDLFLLDIQMDGMSGLELARWLYDQGIRDRVIFISGNPEYALAGYDAHPLHYLLKPVSRERLEEALGLAWERRRPRTVLFQRGGKTLSFPVVDICYLESRDHGVVIHLRDGVQVLPISLADAERMMSAGQFRRCHKSFLVNLAWVKKVSRTDLLLRDGQRIPVSRTFYAPFQSALAHYLNCQEE